MKTTTLALLTGASAGILTVGSSNAGVILSLTSGDSTHIDENNTSFISSATAGWDVVTDGASVSDDTGTSGLTMTIFSGVDGQSVTTQGANHVGAGISGTNGFIAGDVIIVKFNQDVSLDSLYFGHGGTTVRSGGQVTPTIGDGGTTLAATTISPAEISTGEWLAEVVYDDPTVLSAGDDLIITLTTGASAAIGLNAIEVTVVPEPGSLALLGLGGLLIARRRRDS